MGAPIGEEGTGVFGHWTQECYVSTAHFYASLQHMLETDEIEIKLMVGLAGSASANDASADSTSCIDSTPTCAGTASPCCAIGAAKASPACAS